MVYSASTADPFHHVLQGGIALDADFPVCKVNFAWENAAVAMFDARGSW
jgi:hypothetical protein